MLKKRLTKNALGLFVLSSCDTEELMLSRREAGMKSRLDLCPPILPTFDHIMYQMPTAITTYVHCTVVLMANDFQLNESDINLLSVTTHKTHNLPMRMLNSMVNG